MIDSPTNRSRWGSTQGYPGTPGGRQPPNEGLNIIVEDSIDDGSFSPSSRYGHRSAAPSPGLEATALPSSTASSPNKVFRAEPSGAVGTPGERPAAAGHTVTSTGARVLLPFLVKWLNLLCSDALDEELTIETIGEHLKTGKQLCLLMERLVPNLAPKERPYSGGGLHQKPMVKRPCLTNLERALRVAWRQGVHAQNMCSAEDFWNCRVPRITCCLFELFHSLQMREVLKNLKETMRGMNTILAAIGRPLSPQTLEDPMAYGAHFIADFADGTRVMILLSYYGCAGAREIGAILGSPQDMKLVAENGAVLEKALKNGKCPVLLSPVEWASPAAIEELVYQLDLIWRSHSSLEDWQGLMYSIPAKKGKALETLVFKDNEPVNFAKPKAPPILKRANSRMQQQQLLQEAGSPRAEQGEDSRPSTSTILKLQAAERPLWKDGDDPLALESLVEFRADLFSLFPSLEAAFEAFDTQNTKSLTLSEFQWACRAIECEGNSKRVFTHLDMDHAGRIGVEAFLELNALPDEGKGIDTWRNTSKETLAMRDFASKVYYWYGSLDDAFRKFDSSGSGWMSPTDLELLVKDVNLACNPKVITNILDNDKSGRITKAEFCRIEKLIVTEATEIAIIPPQPMLWEDGGEPADLNLLRDFADVLHDHFANPQEAFNAFDMGENGRLNISCFQRCAKSIGFKGDAKKLFVLMDVERGGYIVNEEFFALDRLPASTAAAPAKARSSQALNAEVQQKSEQITLLLAEESLGEEWPSPPVTHSTQEGGEARLPGCAEELEWLYQEDARRNEELEDDDQAPVAERNKAAAMEAIKAVEAESEDALKVDEVVVLSQAQGTTSIEVRVLMPDSSQQRMWLQTAVVDRTAKGSAAAEDAVLVLELRHQQRRGKASSLVAQIDVSQILSITQTGPGDFAESSTDLSFIVSFEPKAILESGHQRSKTARLSPSELRAKGLTANASEADARQAVAPYTKFFQSDDDGASWLLHVIVGPSPWRRRLGICFFDELRILMHFMAESLIVAAAAIGAAAGAAVGSAASRRRSM